MNCENLSGSVITVACILAFLWIKSPFLFGKVMLKSSIIKLYGSCTGVPSTPVRTGGVDGYVRVVCTGQSIIILVSVQLYNIVHHFSVVCNCRWLLTRSGERSVTTAVSTSYELRLMLR